MRNKIADVKLLEFEQMNVLGGKQTCINGKGIDIPFDVRRIFYIYGSDNDVVRGKHANRRTEFVLVNVHGTCKVRVDDGENEEVIELNRPNVGLYLPTMIWKDMYAFSEDAVLLVLASECYDSEEYVRNYEQFMEMVKKGDVKSAN